MTELCITQFDNPCVSVNTHVHADHVTGTGEIKTAVPTCKSVIADVSAAVGDMKVKHGDVLEFGKFEIECRSTPGHTNGMLLTGWKSICRSTPVTLTVGCELGGNQYVVPLLSH